MCGNWIFIQTKVKNSNKEHIILHYHTLNTWQLASHRHCILCQFLMILSHCTDIARLLGNSFGHSYQWKPITYLTGVLRSISDSFDLAIDTLISIFLFCRINVVMVKQMERENLKRKKKIIFHMAGMFKDVYLEKRTLTFPTQIYKPFLLHIAVPHLIFWTFLMVLIRYPILRTQKYIKVIWPLTHGSFHHQRNQHWNPQLLKNDFIHISCTNIDRRKETQGRWCSGLSFTNPSISLTAVLTYCKGEL